jgi:hypothetical protein
MESILMKTKDIVVSREKSDYIITDGEIHFTGWEQLRRHFAQEHAAEDHWIYMGSFTSEDFPLTLLDTALPDPTNRGAVIVRMMEEFRSAAPLYLATQNLPGPEHHLEWLALMHFFSAATPLLEWTHSPYIAAHAATGTESHPDRKAHPVLWSFNTRLAAAICRAVLQKEKIRYEDSSYRALSAPDIFRQLFDLMIRQGIGLIMPVFPKRRTPGFLARQSALTCTADCSADFGTTLAAMMESADKYGIDISGGLFRKHVLPASAALEIRESLFAMNMTARTLNPGLRGFCESLSDYAQRSL